MTTQRRNFRRTPRRRKMFAQFNESIQLGSSTSTPKAFDMLEAAFTDTGTGQLGGLTVMDVRGSIQLIQGTAGATTPSYQEIRCGYVWLDPLLATAGDGSGLLPEPLQDGAREASWIQQWKVGGLENSAPVVFGTPLTPVDDSSVRDIHVRNMRRQPNANAKLMFIVSGGSTYEPSTVELSVELFIMLALP